MINHAQNLKAIVGEGNIFWDQAHLSAYGFDSTRMERIPSFVIFPRDEQDIVQIIRYANMYDLPIVPRGAGSGMSGGSLSEGGIVLAMQKHFSKVLEIDVDNLCVRTQPAVINAHLNTLLKPHHLFFPPDPASSGFSTVGGNIAENAGGMNAVKYGVSKNHLLAMRAVLGSGEVLEIGHKTYKDVAGYDLLGLMCGSEGTLGVMTELTLRLSPLPRFSTSVLICFSHVRDMAETSYSILSSGITPYAMEFLDALTIKALNQKYDIYPKEAEAVLILKISSNHQSSMLQEIEEIRAIAQDFSPFLFWQAGSDEDEEKIWFGRKNASQANYFYGVKKLNEDITLPRSKVAEFLEVAYQIGEGYGLKIPCFGHIGDGNIHTNVMLTSLDDLEKGKEAVKELFNLALSLGGTLSGEHGIGISKSEYMPMAFPSHHLELFRGIKKVFDPKGILNPNKMGLQERFLK